MAQLSPDSTDTLYQINLVIPPGAANGFLIIQVTINGVSSQQLLIPVG